MILFSRQQGALLPHAALCAVSLSLPFIFCIHVKGTVKKLMLLWCPRFHYTFFIHYIMYTFLFKWLEFTFLACMGLIYTQSLMRLFLYQLKILIFFLGPMKGKIDCVSYIYMYIYMCHEPRRMSLVYTQLFSHCRGKKVSELVLNLKTCDFSYFCTHFNV